QIAHLLCSVEIQKDVPPNRVITICTALSGYADKDDGLSTPSRNVHLITERKTAVHPQSETGSEANLARLVPYGYKARARTSDPADHRPSTTAKAAAVSRVWVIER